jgi:hypothetical protein
MLYRPNKSEKHVMIDSWSVREISNDGVTTRHLCGVVNGEGRVCSPIQEFDPSNMSFTSQSGKLYEARGWPGRNKDAEYVWAGFCKATGVKPADYTDVTKEYV